MSAEVLERLHQDGAITIEELADLFGIAKHSVYPYFVDREPTYQKFRLLFRRAADPRVREAFLNDLLPGTNFIHQQIDASLDIDGDGDVDCDDAVAAGIEQVARSADALRKLHEVTADRSLSTNEADHMVAQFHELLGQVMTTMNIVRFLGEQASKRHKLSQRPLALGGRA